MTRHKSDGFSLIEALVALSVLAVSASVILSAAERHTHNITALTERAHARWVAQNHMTRLQAGAVDLAPVVSMGGQDWRVTERRSATADPDLLRVDLTVARASGQTPLGFLTGFIAKGPAS
jgi:general secretion pathway protein I